MNEILKSCKYIHSENDFKITYNDVEKLMTRFQKLMYNMGVCNENKQRLHLDNGFILNFENMTIEKEN